MIWFMTMMMLTWADWQGWERPSQDATDENYGGEPSDDDDTFNSADYVDDDENEDDAVDADADSSDDTHMPTQGLPPFAMTGSVAKTKNKACKPCFKLC